MVGFPAATSGCQTKQQLTRCLEHTRGLGKHVGVGGRRAKNVNPSLGVSIWQIFMLLRFKHLHYALNTLLTSQAEKKLCCGCKVKENASVKSTSGNRKS